MTVKAICNTGPILHLCQIDQEQQMQIFGVLTISGQVKQELENHQVLNKLKKAIGEKLEVGEVSQAEIDRELNALSAFKLHTADVSVVVLAKRVVADIVLTDDLQLRRAIESLGMVAVGSVGILIRACKEGKLSTSDIKIVMDRLFDGSTLYLSEGFKEYVKQLIANL